MFKNHPKGLIPAALSNMGERFGYYIMNAVLLLFSNMGERFGYYIMNAVLLLFLCSKFGLDEGTSGAIYSVFYAGIYVLSLVGGAIADSTQKYKATIQWGLVIMAIGYVLLSIPVVHSAGNHMWLLVFTCVALFLIAFGNGLLCLVSGFGVCNINAEEKNGNDDGHYAVQQDQHGVIRNDTFDTAAVLINRADSTQCRELDKIAPSEENHEQDVRYLYEQEQEALDKLSLGSVTYTHNEVGTFRRPITFYKSREISGKAFSDG